MKTPLLLRMLATESRISSSRVVWPSEIRIRTSLTFALAPLLFRKTTLFARMRPAAVLVSPPSNVMASIALIRAMRLLYLSKSKRT